MNSLFALMQGFVIGVGLVLAFRGYVALRAHRRYMHNLEIRAERYDLVLWNLHASMVHPDEDRGETHAICICEACERTRVTLGFMPGERWRLRGIRLS